MASKFSLFAVLLGLAAYTQGEALGPWSPCQLDGCPATMVCGSYCPPGSAACDNMCICPDPMQYFDHETQTCRYQPIQIGDRCDRPVPPHDCVEGATCQPNPYTSSFPSTCECNPDRYLDTMTRSCRKGIGMPCAGDHECHGNGGGQTGWTFCKMPTQMAFPASAVAPPPFDVAPPLAEVAQPIGVCACPENHEFYPDYPNGPGMAKGRCALPLGVWAYPGMEDMCVYKTIDSDTNRCVCDSLAFWNAMDQTCTCYAGGNRSEFSNMCECPPDTMPNQLTQTCEPMSPPDYPFNGPMPPFDVILS